MNPCPACAQLKRRGAFLCVGCWDLLPREHRYRVLATRWKPVAHARAMSLAVAEIRYGGVQSPLPHLLEGGL